MSSYLRKCFLDAGLSTILLVIFIVNGPMWLAAIMGLCLVTSIGLAVAYLRGSRARGG